MRISIVATDGIFALAALVARELGAECVTVVDPGGTDARLDDEAGIVIVAEAGQTEGVLWQQVRARAEGGVPVLGIAGGFARLCTAGLLPGAVVIEAGAAEARLVRVRVEGRATPFTGAIPAGRVLAMGAQRGEAAYQHDDPRALERAGQVIFRFCDDAGGTGVATNPANSVAGIAGVSNTAGNVVGLLPFPSDDAGGVDQLLRGLRRWWTERRAG